MLQFCGSVITSDGGLRAYRKLDDAGGLTDIGADTRTGKNGRHLLGGLLRQSVFDQLAGYEDVNDADRLCRDPAMCWVVGDRAITGCAASASQMGRFETEHGRGLAVVPPRNHRHLARPRRQLWSGRGQSGTAGRSGRRSLASCGERQRRFPGSGATIVECKMYIGYLDVTPIVPCEMTSEFSSTDGPPSRATVGSAPPPWSWRLGHTGRSCTSGSGCAFSSRYR
jgi:hypothetical protein